MENKPPSKPSPRALLPVMAVFVVLLGLMWWGFDRAIDHRRYPNRNLADSMPSGPVVLEAGWDGHFRVPGTINGSHVRFLVDTGASTVALPGTVAQRLNVARGPRINVQTASGSTVAYLTRLDTVTVGNIVQHDVRAAIIPDMDQDIVLLGMSFLDDIRWQKHGDKLILQRTR